jgi:hypothetical protein
MRRTAYLPLPIALLAFLVVAPSPASTVNVEGWRSDIDLIVGKIKSTHPNPWNRIDANEFAAHAEELKADLPALDEEEIIVRAMQLVALVQDGHTMLRPVNHPAFRRWFPLRIDQFADGVFITAIDKQYAELVGARVLRLGDLAARDAFQKVGSVAFMDSRHSIPKEVPAYISNATILRALKIIDTSHSLPLELELQSGEKRNVSIPAMEWRAVFGWTRQNYGIPGSGDFANVFSAKMDSLPLHLKKLLNGADFYWFELLPEHKTLYLQFNTVGNAAGEPFVDFVERLWGYYDEHSEKIEKFVIDLRYNDGGNGYLLQPMIHGFIRHEEISQRGRLYAITGPCTFSAATNFLGQMIEHTDVVTVGEPAAGPLNWFSDWEQLVLPHSGVNLWVSTLYWQRGQPADRRGYYPPDFPVPVKSRDFFSGNDRALGAILSGEVVTQLSDRGN